MKKIEFKLTMPNRGSWNGGWSGEGKNYTIIKRITEKKYTELFGNETVRNWYYSWSDGWGANVSAREVSGKQKKSNGFCGYDWMISSIMQYDRIMTETAMREME